MAGKIRLLSDEVIGKIAAGEVVERPSAAIKEMVENSLDAGATAVTVEIRDGGISYFRVTDNGSGIAQSEIRMAFERHATSKITSAKDLESIQTLGFRGEALASIAAVAKVTCTTRTRQDASGIRVVNQGGRMESIEEAACPEGTSFVVRDLFFNTPVRLKFLKKPVTEAGYVSDLMMRLILSRPDVSFRYISQGKTLYHSAGDGKLSSAVFSIYGKEIRGMQEVEGHQAGLVLKGFVGTGDSGRATRAHQSFFINGRYMKSSVLSAAVESACRERVMQGRYPTCILHLTMPFETVDVNVHPNKLECRFQNDAAIAEAVEAIIRDAFVDRNPLDAPQVMQLAPSAPTSVAPVAVKKQEAVAPAAQKPAVQPVIKTNAAQPVREAAPQKAVQLEAKPAAAPPVASAQAATGAVPLAEKPTAGSPAPATSPLPQMKPLQPVSRPKPAILHEPTTAFQAFMQSYQDEAAVLAKPATNTPQPAAEMTAPASFLPDAPKPLKMIGTAFNSYILVEYDDSLLLIDQQGVHERLLFDRMTEALDTHSCSQELLVPLIVPATRREQQLLEAHHELLAAIGLTVEAFGETEVSIRSIPMILGQPQAGDLLREILDQLEGERGVISLEKRRAGILALACKKAVRSGEKLNESDLRELVARMVEQKVIPTSPRGTPLIVALTHSDIDRRFRRPH
ncbi:MAG: DNA mismatch repair endonuclease MutL [Aristaeellaceae bacterium]